MAGEMPDDWTMGQLAAQDSYMPPETFGPSNVIDRRSFVPAKPFEQPTEEETFQYELLRDMMTDKALKGLPPLDAQPAPTGDDELDDARGGLRPLSREELDKFQQEMTKGRNPVHDAIDAGAVPLDDPGNKHGLRPDMHGLRQSAEDRLNMMVLESIGMVAPQGGIGSILRPSSPQSNFDDELRVMRGWEPQGLSDRIYPRGFPEAVGR